MNDNQDRTQAYSFDLNANRSTGWLRFGWHKFQAFVTEYSWSGYTVVVSPSIARKLRKGRHGTLEFQGSNYKVSCLDSKSLDKKTVEVHLLLDASESAPVQSTKKKRCAAASTLNLNQRDPVLGIATWVGLILVLLILPGWGEGWGTSDYLSDGFRTVFFNTCDACKCIFGR